MKPLLNVFLCAFFILLISSLENHAQNSPDEIIYSGQITDNLITPVRMALDGEDNLYVTDHNQNCIVKYDVSGNFIKKIYLSFTPISVSLNKNNYVFAGDKNSGNIYIIDKEGNSSLFYTGCVFPSQMVVSPDNLLYIVDRGLQRVIALDQDANIVKTIGIGILEFPSSLEYDKKNERILVGEHGALGTGFNPTCKIWVFDTEGNLLDDFGSHGDEDGEFYRIQGITIGKCNNIYVCDAFQANISVFDEHFNFITKFGEFGDEQGDLNIPLDIAFNSVENILIGSMNTGVVEIFSVSETLPSSNISNSDAVLCSGETTDITIKLTGTSPWNFTYTVNGTNPTIINTSDETYILSVSEPGVYEIIELFDANFEGTCFTGSAVISPYDLIPSVEISTEDPIICRGESTEIKFDFVGTPPWTFTFERDNMNPIEISTYHNPYFLQVSEGGLYEITELSDAVCAPSDISESIEIELFEESLPNFDYEINGLEVNFLNTSQYASTYLWDFGDGSFSIETNPVHEYISPDIYTVMLAASNIECGENIIENSIDLTFTSVDEYVLSKHIKIFPNPTDGILFIEVENKDKTDLTIEIISLTGKVLFSNQYSSVNIQEEIDLRYLSNGVYMIRFKTEEFIKTSKLILNN